MERTYKIGTRTSPLALKQVEEVLGALPRSGIKINTEVVGIDTYGDKDRNTPISEIEGDDFFTKEIDEALLRGDIDFAVHSAKDLPDNLTRGVYIAAVTKPVDRHDVLVSRKGLKLHELPYGARIGTSSIRRKEGLKRFRSDFKIRDIRGNIEERLMLLSADLTPSRPSRSGEKEPFQTSKVWKGLDAIVIARAGLIRLGLEDRITQRIPFDIIEPHPLQGALAITVRESDREIIDLFSKLDMRKKAVL